MLRLPNGLTVWLAARMQARDGAGSAVFRGLAPQPHALPPPAANGGPPATATLRDTDRHLIERTVAGCGGNVSKAARTLGVSRGLVYRHLKQSHDAAANEAPPRPTTLPDVAA